MMDRRSLWLIGVVGLTVVCGAGVAAAIFRASAPPAPPALAHFGEVPPFVLVDHQGRAVTRETFQGRVWIADFIFTSCAGQCLLMTDALRSLQRAFPNEQDLAFVSFSVDPARDRPEVLAAYAERYGADARWWLVTGSRDALYALCTKGFHLAVGDQPTSRREPIAHSVRLVLVDRAGEIRGYYDATDAQQLARLRNATQRLLQERS